MEIFLLNYSIEITLDILWVAFWFAAEVDIAALTGGHTGSLTKRWSIESGSHPEPFRSDKKRDHIEEEQQHGELYTDSKDPNPP